MTSAGLLPQPEGSMRITCERATADDLRILRSYLGSDIKVSAWPDSSLSFKLKNASREQIDAIGTTCLMLGLDMFLKPTDKGDAALLSSE